MPVEFAASYLKHDAEAVKAEKKILDKLKKIEASVHTMRQYYYPSPVNAKLGEIPKSILEREREPLEEFKNWKDAKNPLARLPAEIQSKIWSCLDEPADRLMLALTCIHHAETFEDLKSSKHQAKAIEATSSKSSSKKRKALTPVKEEGPSKKPRKMPPKKPTKSELVPILQRLQDWTPMQKYKLCYFCLRFKLRNVTCDMISFAEKGSWGGGDLVHETRKITPRILTQMITAGYRCPTCCVYKHLQTQEDQQTHKENKKRLASLN
ncbi:hypothetical protein LTS08_004377 [Lithohypha guttulata]|uniref:uncharacterized protein n=1 Tax=Lithohypha guttulata TaxID=1690604 RepID=UPI002DDE936A|nr:hypothetical protein LTR51_007660 [Lithohypha guttulata]KAK5101918.1 hypothetical protein LTS08_004377 [Lithohypha guttulata]